jgi:hypothetical protein
MSYGDLSMSCLSVIFSGQTNNGKVGSIALMKTTAFLNCLEDISFISTEGWANEHCNPNMIPSFTNSSLFSLFLGETIFLGLPFSSLDSFSLSLSFS